MNNQANQQQITLTIPQANASYRYEGHQKQYRTPAITGH